MKRYLSFCVILLALVCSLTACKHLSGTELYTWAESWTEQLGHSQITADDSLIGTRVFGDDTYCGTYQAECTGVTGKNVIFGGAALSDRTLNLSGTIHSQGGSAVIRIRLNGEIILLEPDDTGAFATQLFLESGGNYIMVQYEDFSGTVTLTSEYAKSDC